MGTARTIPAVDRENDGMSNGSGAPPESIRTASKRLRRYGSDPVGKQSHCRTSRTWQTGRPSSPERLCKQK